MFLKAARKTPVQTNSKLVKQTKPSPSSVSHFHAWLWTPGRDSVMISLRLSCQVNCSQETSDQLDCRYFGELLAELNRKTNDLYSCLLQHVEKIGGRYWLCVCPVLSMSGNSRHGVAGRTVVVAKCSSLTDRSDCVFCTFTSFAEYLRT